jgi:DNA-binding transcriptional LysR family regulator
MLRISLEQWRMFLAVVEFGGFNQASQAVYKSQSSIHNAVKKIEESLNIKLFEIEGRKTVLTEAGEMLLRRANYLLSEAEKIEAIGLTLSQGVETKLKIAVDEVFPREILYRVLDTVSTAYPMLQIELHESILSGSTEQLANDEVEIAITPYMLDSGFSESLCTIEFLAVASPQHPLHHCQTQNNDKASLTLEDLKSHRQIVVRDSKRNDKTQAANEGWLQANQRWTVSHIQSSIDIITKGLGYAWLPVNQIEEQLTNGNLKPLKLNEATKRSAQLYLTFKDGDRLGPAANCFVAELRKECQSL